MGQKSTQQKSSKGVPRKSRSGSRKGRRLKYWSQARIGGGYVGNKLSRILRRNGEQAAREWAKEHTLLGADGVMSKLLARRQDREGVQHDTYTHKQGEVSS